MLNLAGRAYGRTQITSDGLAAYFPAVAEAFGPHVDFAKLMMICEPDHSGQGAERKYSPCKVNGMRKVAPIGMPDKSKISTSHVERHNLWIRMANRRFTRLTNAGSRKAENHFHAIALFFAFYSFCRVHSTLKTSPAVAAGLADHVRTLEELVGLLD